MLPPLPLLFEVEKNKQYKKYQKPCFDIFIFKDLNMSLSFDFGKGIVIQLLSLVFYHVLLNVMNYWYAWNVSYLIFQTVWLYYWYDMFCSFFRGQVRTQIYCHHACAHLLLIALSHLLLNIMTAIEMCRNCAICSFSKRAPSTKKKKTCDLTRGRMNDKICFYLAWTLCECAVLLFIHCSFLSWSLYIRVQRLLFL